MDWSNDKRNAKRTPPEVKALQEKVIKHVNLIILKPKKAGPNTPDESLLERLHTHALIQAELAAGEPAKHWEAISHDLGVLQTGLSELKIAARTGDMNGLPDPGEANAGEETSLIGGLKEKLKIHFDALHSQLGVTDKNTVRELLAGLKQVDSLTQQLHSGLKEQQAIVQL